MCDRATQEVVNCLKESFLTLPQWMKTFSSACFVHGLGNMSKRASKYSSCPCALTEHHAMEAYWRNGGKAPRILCLGTRWR
jgi:hypothetical protein